MIYRYAITQRPLSAADGGGWLTEVPDLPGCMSDGKDPQETLGN
jgi:antitoxin HicB